MTESICLDGKKIAKDIKRRCRAIGKTVKQVFAEAKVKYRTYKSWRSEGVNPSFANLKKVYAVLDQYESKGEAQGYAQNQDH